MTVFCVLTSGGFKNRHVIKLPRTKYAYTVGGCKTGEISVKSIDHTDVTFLVVILFCGYTFVAIGVNGQGFRGALCIISHNSM